ncbi:MAG: hypothetical protein ACP5HZ_10785 [Ferrimicrobium sp.]
MVATTKSTAPEAELISVRLIRGFRGQGVGYRLVWSDPLCRGNGSSQRPPMAFSQ